MRLQQGGSLMAAVLPAGGHLLLSALATCAVQPALAALSAPQSVPLGANLPQSVYLHTMYRLRCADAAEMAGALIRACANVRMSLPSPGSALRGAAADHAALIIMFLI